MRVRVGREVFGPASESGAVGVRLFLDDFAGGTSAGRTS